MTRVRRPILDHSILHSDGRHEHRQRVFCGRLGRTLTLDACKGCPAFLEEIAGADADARIECRADGPGPVDDLHADRPEDPALELAVRKVVCVHEDVRARAVARLVDENEIPFVLVVDPRGVVIGSIQATALRRPIAATDLARDVMTSPGTAGEATSVRAALQHMATTHRRHIPIVSHDGSPVGVVRDVEALMAWSRARRP